MEFKKRKNGWGNEETKCPVCNFWYSGLISHIKRKQDEKHKKFYLENSKEVIIKRRVLKI